MNAIGELHSFKCRETSAKEWEEIGDLFELDWWPSGICFLLRRLRGAYVAAMRYTIPRFTFRDHLRDCFGWLKN